MGIGDWKLEIRMPQVGTTRAGCPCYNEWGIGNWILEISTVQLKPEQIQLFASVRVFDFAGEVGNHL